MNKQFVLAGRGIFIRLLILAAVAILIFLLARNYVAREDDVYYWDFKNYWMYTRINLDGFWRSPSLWIVAVLQSIWSSDYNYLYSSLLIPALSVFGTSRLAFIGTLCLQFMLPAMILAWLSARDVTNTRKEDKASLATQLLLGLWVIFYLPFWIPTLRGFPDVVGLIPLIAATRHFVSGVLVTRQRHRDVLLAAIYLYLPILLRKWYCFAIVSVLAVSYLYSMYLVRRDSREQFMQAAEVLTKKFLIIGILLALFMCGCQGGLLAQAIAPNYSDNYSAFQIAGNRHLLSAYYYFGVPLLLCVLAGCVAAVLRPALFGAKVAYYVACALLTLFLFTRVQGLDIHHYLPIAYFLLMISSVGLVFVASLLKGRWQPLAFLSAAVVMAITSFAADLDYIPAKNLSLLVPPNRFPPLSYPVANDYKGLLQDLHHLLDGNDKTVSLFASSYLISYSLLGEIGGPSLHPHMVPSAQIDGRDQFYLFALMADYVIVTDPVQLNRTPDTQRVIVLPNELIMSGRGIGAAYQRVAQRQMTTGVNAYVFKKVRPFTQDEVNSFFGTLLSAYPSWLPLAPYSSALLTSRAHMTVVPGATFPGTAQLSIDGSFLQP